MRTARQWVALVAAVVLCAVVGGVWAIVQGQRTSAADQSAARFSQSATPSATADSVAVTVISDDLASPAQSGTPVVEWPALVQDDLGVPVVSLSTAGSGYTTRPLTAQFGGTFRARATEVAASSKVVVIMGGANDQRATQSVLTSAVSETISNAELAAPDAVVVVIGPASTSDSPPDTLIAVRNTVRKVAGVEKVKFVDPITGGWLSRGTGYFAADGSSLTSKGEQVIATSVEKVLRPLLSAGT